MGTTYKPISPADIEATVAMMADFYAIDGYPMERQRSKALFREFIANENLGRCWLIERDAEVAGYVILAFIFSFEFGGKLAFVDELYIKAEFRGKGIGKDTIDFIKSEARALDLKLLYLEVEHHNSAAKKLYLDKGFESHKRQLLYHKINYNS